MANRISGWFINDTINQHATKNIKKNILEGL